jgi:hypothetical protein
MKRVRIQTKEIRFPPICAVCLRPAEHTFPLEQTVYLQRPLVVRADVPLCSIHYAEARRKSSVERIVERAGLVMGIATGLTVGGGLFAMWTFEQQGNSIVNPLLAAFMGIGFFSHRLAGYSSLAGSRIRKQGHPKGAERRSVHRLLDPRHLAI